jgi:asparagine synthase (glutamine-hydrolysing)
MCGIVGVLSFENSSFQITESHIIKMRDTMVRRGPDDAGVYISANRKLGLGHRRLSIIDLSKTASQPMCNEDGTIWLVFNGEIYNHYEIRPELEKAGHNFRTDHSDTEVIIHAYEEWGIDCVTKFRGMFAIALWDSKVRNLWLIRDRIGIKPLYYSIQNGRITFASEIKAILQDPEQRRIVNEEGFYHYLSFLVTPAPQTLFEGIKKLPCATWLRVSEEGQIREYRYWDVLDHTIPMNHLSENEIAGRILAELRTSVKLRKVSDVPVGVFLSGGIDSSTNTALFSEGENSSIKTFSIGYNGEYKSYGNELHHARKMAHLVNAKHYERLLDLDDLLNFLPLMVHLQDEPIADPVCVPIYYVSKLARENGVVVCQVGEGADELFWGYPYWKLNLALQQVSDRFPWALPKRLAVTMLNLNKKLHHNIALEWLRRAGVNQPIFWGGAEAFSELEKKDLLHPRLRKQFFGFSSYEVIRPIHQRFEEKAWEKSHLNWMTYLDLNLRLPELLLMRVDKMSMGVSIEARVPFLDHKFVELVMSIPESVKIKNGVLKYILKKSVRGLIPDELIDRRKQGFGLPIKEWFFERIKAISRQELDGFCQHTDFLDTSSAMKLVEEGRAWKVWYLVNFILWWKYYIAGNMRDQNFIFEAGEKEINFAG